jgi:hypothetical protein
VTDDRSTIDKLATLGDPPGPPAYDVALAVREGRRRRTRGRVAATTGTLLATAAVVAGGYALAPTGRPALPATAAMPSLPPAATLGQPLEQVTSCVAEKLPVPGGGDAVVSAGDRTGTYLAGTSGKKVLLWQGGEYRAFDAPVARPVVAAVNARGVVVGRAFDGTHPWAVAGGVTLTLPGPSTAAPTAIADSGVVVGSRGNGPAPGGGRQADTVPVVWDSIVSKPRDLPMPEGYTTGEAMAVLPDGRIAGLVASAELANGGGQEAAIWPAGGGMPELVKGPEDAKVYLRNAADGWLFAAVSGAMRYEMATGTWTRLTGKIGLQPNGINARGWVIGGDERVGELYLFDGTKTITLAPVVEAAALFTISDDGRVLGGQAGGATRWSCS